MTQYKKALTEVLLSMKDKKFQSIDVRLDLHRKYGIDRSIEMIAVDLRSINNLIVLKGFFLRRISRLGRSNTATYVLEKINMGKI